MSTIVSTYDSTNFNDLMDQTEMDYRQIKTRVQKVESENKLLRDELRNIKKVMEFRQNANDGYIAEFMSSIECLMKQNKKLEQKIKELEQ